MGGVGVSSTGMMSTENTSLLQLDWQLAHEEKDE
jgi:hypothetical protein